jgi:hypothetical protein
MSRRFKKHYKIEEARALLPQIRIWLKDIQEHRARLQKIDSRLGQLLEGGADAGGESVNLQIKLLAGLQRLLREFEDREIQIKDLDRGLIDFPAIISGKEVFFCWELDDEDIEFWHDLDSGYAGRERL